MSERHELDERFRRGLYHAEAEPPARVHAALADARGWNASGWWFWVARITPLLVVFAGLVFWVARDNFRADAPAGLVLAATVIPGTTGEVHPTAHMDTHRGGAAAEDQPASAGNVAQAEWAPHEPFMARSASREERDHNLGDMGHATTPVANKQRSGIAGRSAQDPMRTDPSASDVPGLIERSSDVTIDPQWLSALPVPWSAHIGQAGPKPTAWRTDYVLAKRHGWLSLHGGWGRVTGKWTDPLAAQRERAEHWNTGWQIGLLGGMEWRSGLGVGTGLVWSQVRSSFDHTERWSSEAQLTVDTNWIQTTYGNGPQLVSTWMVDSLWIPASEQDRRYRTPNRYTLLQVPLQLHWMGAVRRLCYGVIGGVSVGVPLRRSGHALELGDEGPRVVRLEDRRTPYPVFIDGFAGVTVGHQLGGSTQVLLEPLWQGRLAQLGGEADGPSLRHVMLRLRIVHEIPFSHARVR